MSSVELKVTYVDVGTAEDAHRKDVLKWGFKPVDNSSDSAFLWAENGRLWANTLTTQVAQSSVAITQSINNPNLTAANTQIYVRASLSRPAVSYVLPSLRVAVDVHDQASPSYYLAKVEFENEGEFQLHIDTGSSISWVCGFPRGPYRTRFDLTRTPGIPGSSFKASYVDHTHVKGILCHARATFSDGVFRFPWTFCVATSANDKMRTAPANEGLLALSYDRPPGGSGETQLHPGHSAETFIESLLREGLIDALYFCVKLRRRAPGAITFGRLPDLGSEYDFQKTVADRWALPSKRIGIIDSMGREIYKAYKTSGSKPNAALLDTGTVGIYIGNDAADWIYSTLFEEGDYTTVDGTRYIEYSALPKLKHSNITFHLGDRLFALPAKMLQGKYSHVTKRYTGTIQGKSGGPVIEDDEWTFDIMGTEFFRHVLVAFDTAATRPRIAICLNTYDENHED